jgi:hypothetical protein
VVTVTVTVAVSSGAGVVEVASGFAGPVAVSTAKVGIVAEVAAVILGLDVGDVEEPVAADRKINERRLDGGFQVNNPALVNVAGVAFQAGALDVKLLKDAVLDDRDAALLGLEHVDQHFFLHAGSLSIAKVG